MTPTQTLRRIGILAAAALLVTAVSIKPVTVIAGNIGNILPTAPHAASSCSFTAFRVMAVGMNIPVPSSPKRDTRFTFSTDVAPA